MTPTQARAWRTSLIQDRIDELAAFHERIEGWLGRELKAVRTRSKRLAPLPAAERGAVEELSSDERFMLEAVFAKTLRYSVLVTTHILLETSLEIICDGEQRRFGHTLRLKNLTGSGVERAKLYLAKVCGMRFPDGTAEWNRMAVLGDLRNVIVHANGDVSKAKHEQRVRNIVSNSRGLNLRHDRYLEVTDSFIRDALSKMGSFFGQVHRAFPPKLRAT